MDECLPSSIFLFFNDHANRLKYLFLYSNPSLRLWQKKKKKKNIKVEACFPVSYHVKIQTQSCMYMNTGPNSYVTPFYD
jgi:penicillin-binding protein-related factor A (putative recombinase)